MSEKGVQIVLKEVGKNDYEFLFEFLRLRNKIENISHKKMPTFQQHLKFVKSKPYSKWYVVHYSDMKIGTVYLSKQNEIGIHLTKNFDKNKIRKSILNYVMKKHPKERYLINVSPKNKKLINFLENNGYTLIQYTYELIGDKFT